MLSQTSGIRLERGRNGSLDERQFAVISATYMYVSQKFYQRQHCCCCYHRFLQVNFCKTLLRNNMHARTFVLTLRATFRSVIYVRRALRVAQLSKLDVVFFVREINKSLKFLNSLKSKFSFLKLKPRLSKTNEWESKRVNDSRIKLFFSRLLVQ